MTKRKETFRANTAMLMPCWVAATLFVLCASLPVAAKISESSSVSAALSLIDTFDSVCSAQVERAEVADKSDLVSLTPEQIFSMSTVLGYKKPPAAIWSDTQATWYQVQPSLDRPETCLFVSFGITLDHMKSAWDDRFSDKGDWQAFSEAVVGPAVQGGDGVGQKLTGAFAFRPFQDRMIMVAVAGQQFAQTGMVLLRYQKTETPRESCAQDPEACR